MFTKSTYLVRERVAMLKLTDTFDILDAETGQQVAVAQEKPGLFMKLLRLVINKRVLPTEVHIAPTPDAPPVITIRRGFTLFRSKVRVQDADGQEIGFFRQKLLTIGGAFNVFDTFGQQVAQIKGDWKGWNFKFLDAAGNEIGTVTKQWAGLAKEMFTSADNYVINVAPGQDPKAMNLLIAAGIAIDTIYKEA
ncbi:MAG: Scramblase [Planctomycetes bacterium ADurb.Bin126]|nr:MAG: Scramblase [Planctomycetes bacterium ADurb.Bin126]HOD81802.1 phospholipid scramblase-related protein [Phycisphaerae bacterium]HQL75803.1 phospholipid scramblase-related protein [Phycisphaerae bacterium]